MKVKMATDVKKEYVNPSVNIMELDCSGMLCTSDTPGGSEPTSIETPDTEEFPVKGQTTDGPIL